ncbi:MAG: DUF3624 family protein [Rhizobiales bacterium]|nr:DUF3624 family protein [Hyphomicrobiales bacterium]MBI3673127.1 DUF3624 family protein [Hyphomicrobiales bacterium]
MKLGRCPKCMRTSFLFAAGSWIVVLAVSRVPIFPPIAALIWIVPICFTLLWIGHLAAFAKRSAQGALHRGRDEARGRGHVAAAAANWPRRRFLFFFVKAFVFAAVATAFPVNAMAQSCSCSDPNCTCPPNQPNCFINPARQESFCCSSGDTGCGSPLLSWCCPNGTNCYGDNGNCY